MNLIAPTLAQAFLPTFLVPSLAAAGVAAVSVPIIIHILSRRPKKPQPWAAMKFLLAAYKRHRIRTRLEQLLLLALRCLIVLLIGLALAGPRWSALGSLSNLGSGGRVVMIVLDNSLTSGAADATGRSRFETLRASALSLVDSLGQADRVGLITMSRPAEALITPPTPGRDAVRRLIENARPTPAAADFPAALRLALASLEALDDPTTQSFVVVLSDFSAGSARLDSPLPQELSRLGDRATLLMLEPVAASPNVQIASLEPDQRVVVPTERGATPVARWTLKVRRFTIDPAAGEASTVRLSVPGRRPQVSHIIWEAGQSEVELRIDTPLSDSGLITAEAALEPAEQGRDVLDTDNVRQSLVRVRQKLSVLIAARRESESQAFSSRQWLATALAPVADRLGWPIEIHEADAGAITAETLSDVDAAFVLRPDLLGDEGWAALGRWTEGGGLAWFFAPATETPSLWPQTLADTFGLPWSITLEPTQDDPPLLLSSDVSASSELQRLRGEFADLIGRVEVYRRLPIEAASLGAATDVLLAGRDGQPLLIGAMLERGSGRVLLCGTAIDTDWTNLPAKPLFVPMIHEILRAAIDRLQPSRSFEPGDRPRLSGPWLGASKLSTPDGADLLLLSDEAKAQDGDESTSKSVSEAAADGAQTPGLPSVRPIRPFRLPGVYSTETNALTVNINADAASTLAVAPEALKAWLGVCGPWRTIEAANPAAPMHAEAETQDLNWPLLWIVLALIVFETFLARWVSHASAAGRTVDALALNRRRAAA